MFFCFQHCYFLPTLSVFIMSDQMSRHHYITSEFAIAPEFQLVSEQESCMFLDEIHEGYFLVVYKVEDCLNKEYSYCMVP